MTRHSHQARFPIRFFAAAMGMLMLSQIVAGSVQSPAQSSAQSSAQSPAQPHDKAGASLAFSLQAGSFRLSLGGSTGPALRF